MDADLTVVVVADDEALRRRSIDAIAAQSDAPRFVVETSWSALGERVAAVPSTWVAILPDGAEPSPDWISLLEAHLSDPGVGCVGGRVLELDGAATGAGWFQGEPRVAWLDSLGRIHSRYGDIPDARQVRTSEFLRLEGIAVPARDASASTLAGFERWSHFEMAACFRARRYGRAVLFDSSLVVCTNSTTGGQLPSLDDLGAWEAYGLGEIEVLRLDPWWLRAAWQVPRSLLLGSRVSPGLLLWPLYMTVPSRRSRWHAVMRGKVRGLVGTRI